MAALKVTTIKIIPLKEKTEFLMRLQVLDDAHQSIAIELALSLEALMRLKMGLDTLQARLRLSIPENLRPKGRPHLSIVEDEE